MSLRSPSRVLALIAALAAPALCLGACGESASRQHTVAQQPPALQPAPQTDVNARYQVPPLFDPSDVFAADGPNQISPVARQFRPLIYVPNSGSNTVDEIDPATDRIVRHFAVGELPQHVVPSYDLRTLWVTNDRATR